MLKKIFKYGALFVLGLFMAWRAAFAFQYHALSQIPLHRVENANIPVLAYHEIAPSSNSRYVMTVATFKRQMEYLKAAGYSTLTIDSFYAHLKNNIPLPKNSVILTFDDAWTGQIEYAAPILKQNGFTATFYIPVGNVNAQKPVDPYGKVMSWRELQELDKMGFDLESHTLTHKRLNSIDPITAFKEIWLSRWYLEKAFKKPVNHISYPHGSYNLFVESLAVIAGYKTGALINRGEIPNSPIPPFLRIKRRLLGAGITDEQFQAVLKDRDYFDHLR